MLRPEFFGTETVICVAFALSWLPKKHEGFQLLPKLWRVSQVRSQELVKRQSCYYPGELLLWKQLQARQHEGCNRHPKDMHAGYVASFDRPKNTANALA